MNAACSSPPCDTQDSPCKDCFCYDCGRPTHDEECDVYNCAVLSVIARRVVEAAADMSVHTGPCHCNTRMQDGDVKRSGQRSIHCAIGHANVGCVGIALGNMYDVRHTQQMAVDCDESYLDTLWPLL